MTENWLGLITGADGRDHRVHVDAKTGEISNIDHGANTGDGCLASGFLRIDDIHDILISSSIIGSGLAIDERLILLR